jgi:hypothetical protein
MLSHTTNHENESPAGRLCHFIFKGITYMLSHTTNRENESPAGRLCHFIFKGAEKCHRTSAAHQTDTILSEDSPYSRIATDLTFLDSPPG